jgi:iron complex transport system permease protein
MVTRAEDMTRRAAALATGRPGERAWRAALWVLLGVAIVAGLAFGPYPLSPGQVLAILLEPTGLALPWTFAAHEVAIVHSIRLPRVALAIAVGATLAVAGAVMQSLFRNPLAEPALVGVSSGAALGAVTLLVAAGSGLTAATTGLAPYLLPLAAFSGGLAATACLYLLSRAVPGDPVPTMLLIGVAINAIAASGIGVAQYLSDDGQLRQVTFWMMGGLGAARWETLWLPLALMLVAGGLLLRLAAPLNAYLLGNAEARHLGVDVRALTRQAVVLVALAVGAAVAVSGIIGFVGLVIPHLVRLFTGPDNRRVLWGSALLGASFLVIMDTLSRLVVAPAELPIGLACSAIGGPFFLWLLLRRARLAPR